MKTADGEVGRHDVRVAVAAPPSSPAPPSRTRRSPKGPDQWAPLALVDSCTTALRHLGSADRASIGVTSCLRREGRTTIAVGLALAQRYVLHQDTILVEFDIERPALADQLGLSRAPGVAEIIRDGATLSECMQHHESGLDVLVAGHTGNDPGAVVAVLRDSGLIGRLVAPGQVVVADLPPLSPVGHGTLVADLFSTLLLVVRAGSTPASQIRQAVQALDRPPAVILNGTGSQLPRPLRSIFGG